MADQVLTGKAIPLFRLSVLEKALKLEVLGMKRRGASVYSIVKQEFGLKGTKAAVYKQFSEYVEACRKAGELLPCPSDPAIQCLRDEPCLGCEDYRTATPKVRGGK